MMLGPVSQPPKMKYVQGGFVMTNQELNKESTADAEQKTPETQNFADKLPALGWSLFFIWIGVALLLKFDAGVGLLGVGIITLAVQVIRKYLNLKLEGFWAVIGLLFVIGGFWELFEPNLPLVPILLIAAGSALLGSVVRQRVRK
jgi:hypothetical protein